MALLALNAVLLAAQPGLAVPGSLGAYFFGPKLVRAEVLVKDGRGVTDYRIDRGKIRSAGAGSVSLLERDGSLVTIPVATTAVVTRGGRRVPLGALRKNQNATVIRVGDGPATEVRVGG